VGRIGLRIDTHTTALGSVGGTAAGSGQALESGGTADAASAAVTRIGSEVHAATGAITRSGRTTDTAALSGADFVEPARDPASATVGAVRLWIDATRAARDLAVGAAALTRSALLPFSATLVAAAAVLGVTGEIDASAIADSQPIVAALFTLTSRAHLGRRAGRGTIAAMLRVTERIDARTGAVHRGLRTNAVRAAANFAFRTCGHAASAVLGIASQIETAPIAVRQPWRTRQRARAQAAHL
jgi:hypothetical protein